MFPGVIFQPQPTPEEKLIKKDDQSHLSKLLINYINELPSRQKELIQLKFYEGLSYEEIVQKTGLSYRTVYNTIYEALKNLKLDMGKSQYLHSISIYNTFLFFLAAASHVSTS
jgi:RNA polymerase sigma factor (sigma-70 family)